MRERAEYEDNSHTNLRKFLRSMQVHAGTLLLLFAVGSRNASEWSSLIRLPVRQISDCVAALALAAMTGSYALLN